MNIKLMTDAPKHNLALMKISAYHKAKGDHVFIGDPLDDCDLSYGSWLFSETSFADISGGIGSSYPETRLNGISKYKPDYSLYDLNYSLGYTWEWCFRGCDFCKVKNTNPEKIHHSIHEFIDTNFDKICLLNNNTFSDPNYRDTFEEIWDQNLTVIDENGYDLRLLDEEKLECLNRTKFDNYLHFAFDRIEDESAIRRGLALIKKQGIKHPVHVYVMVGYPDWRPIDDTDFDRCEILKEYDFDPFIMVYNRHKYSKSPRKKLLNKYCRMVNNVFTWRKQTFREAWADYWHR